MTYTTYTPKECKEYVKRYLESSKGYIACAIEFGVGKSSLERWVKQYRHEIEYNVKEDQCLKGVSRYESWKDEDGNTQAHWIKTDVEKEDQQDALRLFAEGFNDSLPKATPVKTPNNTQEKLLACYILTDSHIGMRSDDWSLEIAEKTIISWIDSATSQAPDAKQAVFCLQGDIAHFDSMIPVTPASGHVLEADCNARGMNRLIIKLVRYCIKRLLEKHENVHVIYACGNHDQYTAVLQSEWLDIFYEDEKRVTIDTDNTLYHCFEWGDTSLFFHHGHKRKLAQITNVFAGMFRDVFGRTKKSYGHIGHFHHSASLEDQLMKVEIHPTLSGKDDYALHGGWLSQRAANTIIYHKDFGEVGRITLCPEALL